MTKWKKQYSTIEILIVLIFLLEIHGALPPLENSCSFNQFRCSDGSACLLSEKLCNGYEDCPGGEDENGSSQWDCSLTTLSTACSSDEFRCRFGGCIPKVALCDGKASCWGGNDEAFDLCRKRPTRRPSIGQKITPPPSTNKVTEKPISVSKPSTNPSRVTQSSRIPIGVTEHSRQPIIVTQRPKQPIRVTEIPESTIPSRQTEGSLPPKVPEVTIEIPITNDKNTDSTLSCKPVTVPDGSEVSCSSNSFPVPCKEESSPEGTMAYYKCLKYWDPPRTGSKTASQICRKGHWSRLNRNWGCSLQCGISGITATGFIVSGYDSLVGRWPWHVGLYQENPPNSGKFEFFCGGSLVSRRAVLTAAHCVTRSQTSEKRTDKVLAFLGKYNRSYTNDDSLVQRRLVVDIDIPQYYSPKYYEEDIAIMWLDQDASITERVRPICLPIEDDELEPGVYGTLMGWGRWLDRSYPEKLQMANLPVVSVGECRRSHSSLAALTRKSTFCAGFKNGTSACDGDSGGGLVFEDNRRYFIQGVVSAGINSQGQGGGCDPNHYTIFTKVSQFRPWIDTMLDQRDGRLFSEAK